MPPMVTSANDAVAAPRFFKCFSAAWAIGPSPPPMPVSPLVPVNGVVFATGFGAAATASFANLSIAVASITSGTTAGAAAKFVCGSFNSLSRALMSP